MFHVSLLKRHEGPLRPVEAPVHLTAEGDSEFEVESIVGHRIGKRNQPEFLIRWKGYDVSDDTWEPEANLSGASELLGSYKKEHGLMVVF